MSAAEQSALRKQLLERYGERVFALAMELSGISSCLIALSVDELSKEEREQAYKRGSSHLAKLCGHLMREGESAKVTECASLIDGAVTLWALDDLEQRNAGPRL